MITLMMTMMIPVKMITAPLSIWKELAYVRVSPIYCTLVAVMSHRAGGRNTCG